MDFAPKGINPPQSVPIPFKSTSTKQSLKVEKNAYSATTAKCYSLRSEESMVFPRCVNHEYNFYKCLASFRHLYFSNVDLFSNPEAHFGVTESHLTLPISMTYDSQMLTLPFDIANLH